ncbi:hypothetical protein, partial [Salinivibrio sp. AR640]|uniref:hypothetical protein n=1 Tax=Salinivibrio sp. AR640 TaxID=1909437 RepID=UPI0009C50EB9
MKTVYILGAGFSVEAGAPTQAAIMKEAFRLREQDPTYFNESKFNIFENFLKEQMNISANSY